MGVRDKRRIDKALDEFFRLWWQFNPTNVPLVQDAFLSMLKREGLQLSVEKKEKRK